MAKTYRKDIWVKGQRIYSPRFDRKKDADLWYENMKRKKQFLRDGFTFVAESAQVNFIEYSKDWMKKRISNYPASTWKADEQRLRAYVLPKIAELPIATISTAHVKNLLQDITDNGMAVGTRTRVRALLSTIFNSALNEDPPLVRFNPVVGIKFQERRMGTKKPSFIADADQCLLFLKAAKELGRTHLLVASIGLMAGLRKSEMLALKWSSIDKEARKIVVSNRVEQATLESKEGTKRGQFVTRLVPVDQSLLDILAECRKESKYSKLGDYIFARASDGRFLGPRQLSEIQDEIVKASGIKVTVHGLRHSFGREFAEKSGNMKALQSILGHSSSATTDLYSELSGKRLDTFGEVVSFDLDENV